MGIRMRGLCALVLLSFLVDLGKCQTVHPVYVTFYDLPNQKGQNHTAIVGSQCYNMPSDFNDKTTSFGGYKGSALNSRLVAFDHICCQGDWIGINPGDTRENSLEETGFNNRISSVRLKD